MKKLVLSLIISLVVSTVSISQQSRIDFKYSPQKSKTEIEKPGYRSVSFRLIGVIDDAKRIEIQNVLNNSGDVIECNISQDGKCFMFVKEEKTADYIRAQYFLPNYVDFDFSSVKINDQNLLGKAGNSMPDDFPKYIDTGNPEADKADYAARKAEWVEQNPERYDEMSNKTKTSEELRREEIIKLEKSKK